jgi:hypothetical protein
MKGVLADRAPSRSSSRRKPGSTDAMGPALARPIGAPHPWLPASAGMTKEGNTSLIPHTVIPAPAGIHTRELRGSIATSAPMDPRLRGDDEGGEGGVTTIGTAAGPSGVAPSVRHSPPPSSSRRKPGPTDTAQPASARAIGVPHPWLRAFAGMTKGEDTSLIPHTVIPAEAGIHTRRPRGSIATPAPLDPRLRGDDEGGGGPLTTIGTATGPSGVASVRHSTPPSSSRRKPGPMDTVRPASARPIGVPYPWLPASAGMTKGEGDCRSPKRSSPRRRESRRACVAMEPCGPRLWIPGCAGMTNLGGTNP